MTHSPDLASRIVGTIQEQELAPRARWIFVVRNALVIALAVISVLLGSLTVATSEFLLADRDWDLVTRLGERNTMATLQSLPYLWLAALLLLLVLTYGLFTRTRRGYRFAPFTVIGGSVVLSLACGSALYVIGIGPHAHDYARAYVPAYDRLVVTRDRFWMNPEQGLLGGTVIGATTTREFLLRDARGDTWLVSVETEDAEGVIVGARVRAIGSLAGTSTFSADTVLPWTQPIVPSLR